MIRDATKQDAAILLYLLRQLATYEGLLFECSCSESDLVTGLGETFWAIVATDASTTSKGDVVAMAIWFPTYVPFRGCSGIWMESLVVTELHRNQGYGRALVEELQSRTNGPLEWAVANTNRSAIFFYEHIGGGHLKELEVYRRTK